MALIAFLVALGMIGWISALGLRIISEDRLKPVMTR
jgi:hypothetical protein